MSFYQSEREIPSQVADTKVVVRKSVAEVVAESIWVLHPESKAVAWWVLVVQCHTSRRLDSYQSAFYSVVTLLSSCSAAVSRAKAEPC